MVAAIALAVLTAHGAFRQVVVTEQVAGPFELIYRTAPQGDFTSVRRITTELERAFPAAGIHEMKPFDIFPPPGAAPSQIGLLVGAADVAKAMAIPNRPSHRTIPAQRFVTTRFSYRSPLSFMVGFWKVDPALRQYRAANNLQQTWAGTINEGRTILYLQPVEPIANSSIVVGR